MWYRALLVALVVNGCAAPESLDERTLAATNGTTVVSLTFDDTHADNFQVAALAEARGMRAVFYVNSGRIGQSGSLSLQQLRTLEAAGHEIAGHTISHARLAAIEPDEARRQICNDRVALLNLGFRITSFAYPFSSQNATVQQIVEECGYNSGRLVGGLVMPSSCNGCPYANPMPPVNAYGVRTNDSVDETTTLQQMQQYVLQAEQNGGGWVPLVFHHVCDGCDPLAIRPSLLATFLDWLEARESLGTVVGTVDEVMGGSVKPGVEGPPVTPPPTSGNLLQNASLESDTNGDGVPECWQRGGSGTNAATYTLTNNAFDGSRAQRIDVTSLSSGARRLVSRQDTGTCAPAVSAGRTYRMTARYISNTQPFFSVYYRNSAGGWVWYAQSPRLPASSSYALATYTTPAMPAGATAISVGLSIGAVGSLTMDAFTLVDTASSSDTTPPTVSLTSPANGATVSGAVTIAADASDNAGIARVEMLVDGTVVGSDTSSPYSVAWNTSASAGRTVTLTARAVDTSNNATTSASRTVTVAAPPDATPPTVTLTSPANGATVSGFVRLAADATDNVGIARVEFLVNGNVVATEVNAPYELDWDASAFAGQTITITARAFDAATNVTTSAARQVTVAPLQDTTPPTVALTSPTNASTVSTTVRLSADAADAGGIARVEFFVNGTLVATEIDAPYELDYDASAFAGQTITIIAHAIDNAGNEATSASSQVTVAGGVSNLIQNPSLETDANNDQVPDCWQRGGSGTNTATYTLTNDAFSGSVAQRIDVTSLSSGARRIVTRQDTGQCAPAAAAGATFTVSARYISNTQPVFTVYYRNASGSWVFLAQSPRFPASSTYALGTWTTPAMPAGATHMSIGLSIISVGSLTMDDFQLTQD